MRWAAVPPTEPAPGGTRSRRRDRVRVSGALGPARGATRRWPATGTHPPLSCPRSPQGADRLADGVRTYEAQTSALTFAPASWAGDPAGGALRTPGRLPPDELSPKADGGVRKRNLVAALGAYLALQPPTPSPDRKLTPYELMRMPWRVPRVLPAPSASKKWSSPAEGPGDTPGPRDGKSASPPPRGGLCTPRGPSGCRQAPCPEFAPLGVRERGRRAFAGRAPLGRGPSRVKPSSAVAQFHDFADEGGEPGWRPWPDQAPNIRRLIAFWKLNPEALDLAGLHFVAPFTTAWPHSGPECALSPAEPSLRPRPLTTQCAPRPPHAPRGSQCLRGGPRRCSPGRR